ncbi:hypothetical protein DFH29DRAFT_571137 [Suillus ampliporus]|nr:hypothetical protein DFH29DRAFT_571137 [Suillus ampliporus]
MPYDPLDVSDLIVSFLECFSPALEKLHVDFSLDAEFTFANPVLALGFDVVAPLLSFSHLKDLDLDSICASAISDASLKTMAQSFPQLENFCFGSDPWLVPPSLTFTGLVHLIHHCRCLCSIRMPFSACSVDTNSEPFSETIPNEKITRLFVGFSPIVDAKAVVCQLHTLLPELIAVDIHHWMNNRLSAPPPFEHYEDEWSRVNEFLEVLTTSAKMREIKMGKAPQEPPMVPA